MCTSRALRVGSPSGQAVRLTRSRVTTAPKRSTSGRAMAHSTGDNATQTSLEPQQTVGLDHGAQARRSPSRQRGRPGAHVAILGRDPDPVLELVDGRRRIGVGVHQQQPRRAIDTQHLQAGELLGPAHQGHVHRWVCNATDVSIGFPGDEGNGVDHQGSPWTGGARGWAILVGPCGARWRRMVLEGGFGGADEARSGFRHHRTGHGAVPDSVWRGWRGRESSDNGQAGGDDDSESTSRPRRTTTSERDEPASTTSTSVVELPDTTTSTVAGVEDPVADLAGVAEATVQIVATGVYRDPEIGTVDAYAGAGSGFFVSSSGLALTAYHVVAGAESLAVFLSGDDQPHTASVIASSECSDVALLQVDGLAGAVPHLEIFDGAPRGGLRVHAAGHLLPTTPGMRTEYLVADGIIADPNADDQTLASFVPYNLRVDARHRAGGHGRPARHRRRPRRRHQPRQPERRSRPPARDADRGRPSR